MGMTGDISKRVMKHKDGKGSKFTTEYEVKKLVYYEKVNDYQEARDRERQIKWWKRKWKLALIEQMNPEWRDLSEDLTDHR